MADYIDEFERILKTVETTDLVRSRILQSCLPPEQSKHSNAVVAVAVISGVAAFATILGIQKYRFEKSRT